MDVEQDELTNHIDLGTFIKVQPNPKTSQIAVLSTKVGASKGSIQQNHV